MTRHSFIQMSKLTNVKERINYITGHARQENLYATYQTADSAFWSALAKEAHNEFKRSNVEGKCIEARELIIALPEEYTKLDPQQVLESFTDEFRKRYNVECVSALHHNKRKALEQKIQQTQKTIAAKLDAIPTILQDDGYPDAEVFIAAFKKATEIVKQYRRDLSDWERKVKSKQAPDRQSPPPEKQSVRNRLRQLQAESKQRRTHSRHSQDRER